MSPITSREAAQVILLLHVFTHSVTSDCVTVFPWVAAENAPQSAIKLVPGRIAFRSFSRQYHHEPSRLVAGGKQVGKALRWFKIVFFKIVCPLLEYRFGYFHSDCSHPVIINGGIFV